jgi:hypothetical protein
VTDKRPAQSFMRKLGGEAFQGAPTRPGLSRVGAGEPVAWGNFYDRAIAKGMFCTEICLALMLGEMSLRRK